VQDSVQQEPLFVDSINVPSKENTRFLLTELFFRDLRASERESSLRDPLFVLSTDTQETIATLQRVVVDYLFTLDADARAREYVAQDKPLLSVKQALDRTYNTIDKLLLPDVRIVLDLQSIIFLLTPQRLSRR
jgi:hypothetical protein